MTQGIVFKKAKGEAEDSNGKKIKFSDFLKTIPCVIALLISLFITQIS